MKWALCLVATAILVPGCRFPDDPEGTLDDAQGAHWKVHDVVVGPGGALGRDSGA